MVSRKPYVAVLTITTAVSGLLSLFSFVTTSMDSIILASDVGEVAMGIESHASLSSDKDTPLSEITGYVEDKAGLRDGAQFLMKKGSTAGDYCIVGRNAYEKEGIDYPNARGTFKPVDNNELPCDGAEMEYFIGEETIDEDSMMNTMGPAGLLTGAGSGVALISLSVFPRRRDSNVTEKILAPKTSSSDVSKPKNAPVSLSIKDKLRNRMDTVIRDWSEYETDPVKVLDYPMISNMGFAPTSNFHLAMLRAKNSFRDGASVETMQSVVTELEHSYNVMISEAKRMKWSSFSKEEQKHLRTAQKLLNMVMNSSSSPNERNVAYKKLLKEIEGIITLAPSTILEIESLSMLGIEASPSELVKG